LKIEYQEQKEKVEELDETVKEHEKVLRKYEWNIQDI
jgi:hypothetical protein